MKKRVRMRSKRVVKKKVMMDLHKMIKAPMIQRTQNKLAKRMIRAHQKVLMMPKPRHNLKSPIKRKSSRNKLSHRASLSRKIRRVNRMLALNRKTRKVNPN